MNHGRKGMTLIELLAAVAILSAVAATGVRLLTESGAATTSAKLRIDAVAILDRWRAMSTEPFDSDEWQWTDEFGRTWLVRATESPSTAPAQGLALRIRPRQIHVALEMDGSDVDVLKLNCVVPADREFISTTSRAGEP